MNDFWNDEFEIYGTNSETNQSVQNQNHRKECPYRSMVRTSPITNLINQQAYFFGVFLWWAPFEAGKKCFTWGTDFAANRAFREAKSSATLNRILFDSKRVLFDRKRVFLKRKWSFWKSQQFSATINHERIQDWIRDLWHFNAATYSKFWSLIVQGELLKWAFWGQYKSVGEKLECKQSKHAYKGIYCR